MRRSPPLDDNLENESPAGAINWRTGSSEKMVLTPHVQGDAGCSARSGREARSKLIAKYQRRFPDFDDSSSGCTLAGMTLREIRRPVLMYADPRLQFSCSLTCLAVVGRGPALNVEAHLGHTC